MSALTQQDDEKARVACGSGDSEYHVWCHTGYVKNLVDLTADPTDALAYCGGFAAGPIKQACYHAIGEEIWVLTNDRAQGEAWCGRADGEYREYCRRGAGLVTVMTDPDTAKLVHAGSIESMTWSGSDVSAFAEPADGCRSERLESEPPESE